MGKFVKGDIVVTPFPFTDLSSNKKRPALIVADLQGDDALSNLRRLYLLPAWKIFTETGFLLQLGYTKWSGCQVSRNRIF